MSTGFAVVVPWERLLEITEIQEFRTHLDLTIELIIARSGARPAGLSPDIVKEPSSGPTRS